MNESQSGRPGGGAEPPEEMAARVRASFGRQAMMATLGVRLSAVRRGIRP